MKKILISLFGVIVLLTGCFGGSSDSGNSPQDNKILGFSMYNGDDFYIQVSDEWETLTQVQFKSTTPENTVIAFRNNIRDPKFTANVVIVKNELGEEPPSASDYAKTLFQHTFDSLSSSKQIQVEETDIYIGNEAVKSLFAHMEGAEGTDSDLKRFMQFSGIKDGVAYIAIGSMLATDSESTMEKVETMVGSFGLK